MPSAAELPPPAFPIVGIGASAGGFEAFTQLLGCLPPDTGLAFVLVQHLDPNRPSLLGEGLARATTMPVRQAEHGMRVEPNHVYVIVPNTEIALQEGRLMLSPRRTERPNPHLPVDFFLQSLAAECGDRSIAVILSGTGSDGTAGLHAVRAEDGFTFAQDPRSAKFPGMPQSAIDAGVVEHCMEIPQLAEELVRLSRRLLLQPGATEARADEEVRAELFARVHGAIGVDFREFKPSTVTRRIARRLALRKVADLPAYLKLIDAEPDEIRALYEDMLIHVTSFFRDPDMFESLRLQVFPELVEHKAEGSPVRIWVVGCSTGEEVYSIAIAWLEFASKSSASHSVQIFGSDVSEPMIQRARAGVYSESAMRDVGEERRKRYFSPVEGGHCINKSVRDLCVFVSHDLVRDPPFSKLDLVSCRNVLIYFDQPLQKRVLPTLQYCLNQPGFLVLGHNESISGFGHLFSVVDRASKIFVRTAVASSIGVAARNELGLPTAGRLDHGRRPVPENGGLLAKHLDRLLLSRYCPPGVLVDEKLNVLLFRGRTGAYLQAAPGPPQSNLIGMARGGLLSALRSTIARAQQEAAEVSYAEVEIDQDGATKTCDLTVLPFSGLPKSKPQLFVVLFEESRGAAPRPADAGPLPDVGLAPSADQRRIARLEYELAATRAYVHTLVEEHGRANDELGTSNEELMSGNEELQSMNEELETAKEELQSINEELTTLNDELQLRNQEITQVNSDLLNLALTVDIPILTLDAERRIRRFTPKAQSAFNVVPSDVGRSIDAIKLQIDVPDLNEQIAEVIATSRVKETEVKDREGRWHRLRIRPYTTADDRNDGVLLSLVDIDALKLLVAAAELARAEAERANSAKDGFLAMLSHELRTPLSSMLLNAQRLSGGDVTDDAEVRRAGESLERATRVQARLIDDLLDVSRIVAGKLLLDFRPVDLCATVQAVLDSVAVLIESKAIVLSVTLDPALGMIWADRGRVQQVVANLISNAIKFTPRGGQLTVVVDAVQGAARLRVKDTGIGIDAEFLPHVFARFSQRDSSITRNYGGLGLGLALVRHLVELHGGTVLAESEGVEHGATFSITLPLEHAGGRAAAGLALASARAHGLDRPGRMERYDALAELNVLCVDDDLSTREAVREVLRLAGARVELAGSAADGLASIDTFSPRVILCDIAMPGEDGYAFIRKLRARAPERGGLIPALAFTALASEDDRSRVLAAGFQLHLAKPIDIDRLREAVRQLSTLTVKRPQPAAAASTPK